MKEYFESIFKRSLGRLMVCILGYFAGMGIMNCLIYNPKLAYASFLAAACLVMTTAILSFARAKDKYDKDVQIKRMIDTDKIYKECHDLSEILAKHTVYTPEHIRWEIERFYKLCDEYAATWTDEHSIHIVEGVRSRVEDIIEIFHIEL